MSAAKRVPVAQREAAAGGESLSADLHVEWARDPSPQVRRAIAMRGDLADDAARLSQDADRQVRELLARNPQCPTAVLIALLDDDQFHVRWNAAQNPSATRQVHLEALRARHDDVAEAVGQLGGATP